MSNNSGKKGKNTFLVALISLFAFCSSATGVMLADGVVGTYQGEIWSGGRAMPGITSFSRNSMGEIIGKYSFEELEVMVPGELFQCMQEEQKRKLVCKWKDKYGTGVLDIGFSNDFRSFDGFWNAAGSSRLFPWNGRRTKKSE